MVASRVQRANHCIYDAEIYHLAVLPIITGQALTERLHSGAVPGATILTNKVAWQNFVAGWPVLVAIRRALVAELTSVLALCLTFGEIDFTGAVTCGLVTQTGVVAVVAFAPLIQRTNGIIALIDKFAAITVVAVIAFTNPCVTGAAILALDTFTKVLHFAELTHPGRVAIAFCFKGIAGPATIAVNIELLARVADLAELPNLGRVAGTLNRFAVRFAGPVPAGIRVANVSHIDANTVNIPAFLSGRALDGRAEINGEVDHFLCRVPVRVSDQNGKQLAAASQSTHNKGAGSPIELLQCERPVLVAHSKLEHFQITAVFVSGFSDVKLDHCSGFLNSGNDKRWLVIHQKKIRKMVRCYQRAIFFELILLNGHEAARNRVKVERCCPLVKVEKIDRPSKGDEIEFSVFDG